MSQEEYQEYLQKEIKSLSDSLQFKGLEECDMGLSSKGYKPFLVTVYMHGIYSYSERESLQKQIFRFCLSETLADHEYLLYPRFII